MTFLPRIFMAVLAVAGVVAQAEPAMKWTQMPSIPDPEGFAAAFAGVSGGALLVAGGANIPENKWGEVLVKRWYDSVFVLERPDGAWKQAGRLPRALGYGVSVTWLDRVICIGGSDSSGHSADVFSLQWKDGALVREQLPPLPQPCANACGALVGEVVLVAGGIETPTATSALNTLWALDLAAPHPAWRILPPCPGPARMLAVAGASGGAFYLFSGAALTAGADGKPVREYLRDAWRYTPASGWERLADLPRATVAAASPAVEKEGALLVVSGDDGANVNFTPVREHPGFPRKVLAYDLRSGRWSEAGEAPFSRATVPTTLWQGRAVFPNGEVRPRERTPEVWALEIGARDVTPR